MFVLLYDEFLRLRIGIILRCFLLACSHPIPVWSFAVLQVGGVCAAADSIPHTLRFRLKCLILLLLPLFFFFFAVTATSPISLPGPFPFYFILFSFFPFSLLQSQWNRGNCNLDFSIELELQRHLTLPLSLVKESESHIYVWPISKQKPLFHSSPVASFPVAVAIGSPPRFSLDSPDYAVLLFSENDFSETQRVCLGVEGFIYVALLLNAKNMVSLHLLNLNDKRSIFFVIF